MNILITGARSFVAFELMRNFYKNGEKVFIADSLDEFLCKDFLYYEKSFTIASCNQNLNKYKEDLIKIINENNIDVLIPTCEEVFFVSMIKSELKVNVLTSEITLLKSLHDKFEFTNLFENTPKTMLWSNYNNEFDNFIIKRRFSRFGCDVYINEFPKARDKSKWVVQEFVKGDEICAYAYAQNGKMKFCICYKKKSSKNVATEFFPFIDDKISNIVSEFIKKSNYNGNISFDIIKNDKGYFFIECNPRTTSGLHCLSHLNFTKLFFSECDVSVKEKKLALTHFYYNPLKGYSDKNDILKGEKNAILIQLKNLWSMYKISKKHNISLTQATTFDIEWNG